MNRFDDNSAALTEVEVMQMGSSLHFRSGPASIYYNPKDVTKGEYTVSATFLQWPTVISTIEPIAATVSRASRSEIICENRVHLGSGLSVKDLIHEGHRV